MANVKIDFATYQQRMIAHAKMLQGDNYAGDDYYLQPDTWNEGHEDGLSPEEAVESDMSYWDA